MKTAIATTATRDVIEIICFLDMKETTSNVFKTIFTSYVQINSKLKKYLSIVFFNKQICFPNYSFDGGLPPSMTHTNPVIIIY